ncbi:MAG TPA: di-heme oxidoredictase family protein, partial [Blastocatellia bacterium]|nr:di-heme oxidoredictase family protein [Blastocatellia bacterium]
SDVVAGSNLFDSIGCAVCHVRTIVTAPAGTIINGGRAVVPAALGNKIIHPFSDFLLHDVGTGDGIVQNGGQGTRNQLRTPPLWGVRSRIRLMHDGESLTFNVAILRHGGQATAARNNYSNLSTTNKQRLIAFLLSL